MKTINIYINKKKTIIYGSSLSIMESGSTGARFGSEPNIVLKGNLELDELINQVLDALKIVPETIPEPQNYNAYKKSQLKKISVSSFKKLYDDYPIKFSVSDDENYYILNKWQKSQEFNGLEPLGSPIKIDKKDEQAIRLNFEQAINSLV